MTFTSLSEDDKNFIIERYKQTDIDETLSKDEVQEELSDKFDVAKRTIRTWIKNLGLVSKKHELDSKILIYDIETSRCNAKVWWTGKTYINYKQLRGEPKIISIAWKWLGEETVYYLTWDKDKDDREMIAKFLDVYNSADLIIGQNNDKFDNRWLNARAMKHRLNINVFVKSFDIMKQCKRLFRLPSYSMDYVTKFLGVTHKQAHEGITMWDKIEDGTKEEHDEYLKKMVEYNIGDIVSTEEMYINLRKYMGNVIHFGALKGGEKYSCPNCGGLNIEKFKTTTTSAGTIQHLMICKDDNVQFKMNNTQYMKFLNKDETK